MSLKDNLYITDGYRAYLPSRLCIKRYRLAASAGCARGAPAAPPPLHPFVWSACCFPAVLRAPCSLAAPSFSSFSAPSSLRDLSFSPARVLDPWTNDGNNDDEVANSSGALLFTKGSHPLFHSVFIGGTCWTRPHRQWRGHTCSCVYLSFVYF